MQCPTCGREMPDYALFCGHCGTSLVDDAARKTGKRGIIPTTADFTIERWEAVQSAVAGRREQAGGDADEMSPWNRYWRIPLAFLIGVAALVFLALAIPVVQEQVSLHSDQHRVTFVIRAPGYNGDATPLPVNIEGTRAGGRVYSETVYLDGGGNGVVLEPGDYTLSFPGGSILANGTVLVAPETTLQINVPQGLPRNAFVQVPTDQVVEYAAVAPLDTSEELLDSAYLLASANPADHGKAQELRDNALKAHEEAVGRKDAHTAKVQANATGPLTVAVGDSAQFIGTIELCPAEDVAARLQDDSIQWNLYGRTLAVLWLDEPRQLLLQDHDRQASGWYDDEGVYHSDEVYTERYEMQCLLLNADVEGVYSYGEGDDGTLAAVNGWRVLVSGKVSLPDWSESLVSPIVLANPTIEGL